MSEEEELLVQEVRCLQFWRNWVIFVVCACHRFVFGAAADSQEKLEDRPRSTTSSDGGTASRSDGTSSGKGEWDEITTGLTAKSSAPGELQISNNIDPAGEFNVPLVYADEASQPTDAAAKGASAQCQTPPSRRSLEDFKEQGIIITAQRTPKPAVQDVKIGQEVLVMNTRSCFVKFTGEIESLDQDYVDAHYEERFRKLDNAAACGLPVEAKPFQGPGHVPPVVTEGSVSTFALLVDKTKTTLVPSLEEYHTAVGEGAEVLANLEQKSPQVENDGSDSLGQGSS